MLNETQQNILEGVENCNFKAIARCISIVENELDGSAELLLSLKSKSTQIIGITGPPGAGKSSILNSIISELQKQHTNCKIGIVAIDPTSPFNYGSLLGDRIRMAEHFNNPNIYIRSLATRGALGGLSSKIIEVIEVMKAASFDFIFVETVGVGQSEIEVVGLADTTVLVLVPEAGDEVQTIKSGVMEIADVFVVNKADRIGADTFIKNLAYITQNEKYKEWKPPILKTIATQNIGIENLISEIYSHKNSNILNDKKKYLMVEKLYHLIQNQKMKNIKKNELLKIVEQQENNFNIFKLAQSYLQV
jgi:LAO/AO transport system kinase